MRACRFPASRTIDRAAFDAARQTLTITFRETGKYVYEQVPAEIFDALCAAPSAGAFFNAAIKIRFAYRRDPERRRFGPSG